MSAEVRVARDEAEVRRCWPAFRELRPHLPSDDEFVRRWRVQAGEGYELAYVDGADCALAAAGYRVLHTMAWGRVLYLDDLVALEREHGTGLGTLLLRHVQDVAGRRGCDAVHLDTGYARHRAHRTYLRNGFRLDCHHLSWQVPGE